jgi:ribosomal protein S18 acetylase RimI-like enzyme
MVSNPEYRGMKEQRRIPGTKRLTKRELCLSEKHHMEIVNLMDLNKGIETFSKREKMEYSIRTVTIDDYDALYELWDSTEQSRRALNPVDDSREGIERYLKRNPNTCFAAVTGRKVIGVILTGHDGRRAIIHHMCVHPDYRRMGIARRLVSMAEDALKKEGIQKVFGLVFKDNDTANTFWEAQGYSLRTNLNYRNKSLNEDIPTGE